MKENKKTLWQRWTSINLLVRIACGLLLGTALALLVPSQKWIGRFGTIFVETLKSVAPILVAVLVTSSIAQAQSGLGRKIRKVLVLYVIGTLVAAATAVVGCFIFSPDMGSKSDLQALVSGKSLSSAAASAIGVSDVFQNLIKTIFANPIAAIADANYLGILFWAVVIGLALKALSAGRLISAFSEFSDVISHIVSIVIQFIPFGVMGLIFNAVSTLGANVFITYGTLLAVLVGSILVMALIINPLIVAICTRSNPFPLVWQCLKTSAVSAFFTCSSAANIPVNMKLCSNLGVDKGLYSVSIPLGSTINMEGAAITITTLTLAFCSSMGIEVTLASSLVLCIIAAFGACGTSGVGGGSILLVPMACALFGLGGPAADIALAVGFLLLFIQDPFETALNSSTDALFTATVDIAERKRQ